MQLDHYLLSWRHLRDNDYLKWPLVQLSMEGFSLKEILLSYNESYVLEMDVEGMFGVKKKK